MNRKPPFPLVIIFFFLFYLFQGPQYGQAVSMPVTGISLDKASLTLALGEPPQQLNATIQPNNATNQNVVWTSSNPDIATVTGGVVTPHKVGRTTIVATSEDGGKIATSDVTVVLKVTGVTLDKNQLNMILGSPDQTLKASITPANATNQAVTWESDNKKVATVNNGTVHAVGEGSATITVTTVDGSHTAASTVTVTAMPVSGLTINKRTLTLSVSGSPETLTATIQPANASYKNLNWHSTNTNVATVDQTGKITPKAAGTTTIVVATQDRGYTATCEVIVVDYIAVSQVTLDRSSLTLNTDGSTATLVATVSPSNASNKSVTWTSSNTSVASVNSNGVVTPRNPGTTTITATTVDGNKKASATVTVQSTSAKARNLDIDVRSSSSVDLSWSGTTGSVRVELKRRSSSSTVDSTYTSSRTARFSGLSRSAEYEIYIDGYYIDRFSIDDYDEDYNDDEPEDVEIEQRSSSSVRITWEGTSGYVDVELRRGSRTIDSESTSSRSVTFYDLSTDTDYDVYMDDEYVDDFELDEDWDEDDYYEDVEDYDEYDDEVSSFRVVDTTASTVELSWRAFTSGYTSVVIKRNGRVIDSLQTRDEEVTFRGLTADTEYDVYINGHFEDSFTTDDSSGSVRNFSIVKRGPEQKVDLSWSGGETPFLVELKKNSIRVDSTLAFDYRATFARLDYNQEYTIHINSEYMGSVKLDSPYSYPDIKGFWAQEAIERLSEHQIIKGFSDGTFKPKNTVTREQFVTMLVQAKKYALVDVKKTDFADLQPNHWSARAIQTAIKNGIIKPKEYGAYFQPTKAITREEMAIMLARAEKLKADAKALYFTDTEQIANKGLVGAIVKGGLITGYPDNTFKPKGFLDRASAATVINKVFRSW